MMEHGGNIYAASRETGIPEREIIDFSASINPLGVPASVVAAIRKGIRDLPNYPEAHAEPLAVHLSSSLALDRESIICGNGSTELIYLVARALNPGKVLIPAPTFSEYERACKISNTLQVMRYELKRENNFDISPDGFIKAMETMMDQKSGTGNAEPGSSCVTHHSQRSHMAFLCNPNNPTGRLIGKKELLRIAGAAERMKCCLVVDEAFIDFCPGESVVSAVAGNPYLIVLRSLTKFFALSGLRIGYGVFPPALAGLIRQHKEPWTVNTLALRAGIVALRDEAYKKESTKVMRREKRFLEKCFRALEIGFMPSSANYYLLQIERAHEAVAVLKKKGILVRDCSNFAGLDKSYIRVAIKSRRDNAALIRELSLLCRE
ncbi:MAG: threonine-phosphate decarboxylase CobD [Nitrospirae bacterium]|nr:threonine-phosphate decarboxylase CobD [Nitrospirota bacterium]MCL5422588.1 threonine-phosphate decarboxylase CobD [Nitrospirota bacterium]